MTPVLTKLGFRNRTMKESDEAVTHDAGATTSRPQGDEELRILADTRQEVGIYLTGDLYATYPSSRYLGTITDVKSLEEEVGEEESDFLLGVSLIQEMPEQVQLPSRETEIAWISSHSGELKVYQGQWIVVEGRQLIAHDFDFVKVVDEARSKGIDIPYVTKVEVEKETPFVG